MLDVHAPHEPLHTWKAFFIHIATIVVGLFIAVALEQSVEALHNHHEVAALREDLNGESRQAIVDARGAEAAQIYEMGWLDRRASQVRAAMFEHRPLEREKRLGRCHQGIPQRTAGASKWRPRLQQGLA
jgi:hypothetical protein